jgi:NAD(P)-dependent dehydrogenase (short-subunit alcohol dehydrogenase family)
MDTSIVRGKRVLITGASGGIGQYLCHELAQAGAKMFLVAYPGVALKTLAGEIAAKGAPQVAYLEADVADPEQRQKIASMAAAEFGGVDILIHNAGVEYTALFDHLDEAKHLQVLRVNLEGPMMLTRLLLPGMLAQGGGSILLMSSLAGKAGPACQEPYAASKAGLLAFGQSLRASYGHRGIRVTGIAPGFVAAGIYERLEKQTGQHAPSLLGVSRPEAVVKAMWRALETNAPEILVNPLPVKPLFLINLLWPSLGEKLVKLTGAHAFFNEAAERLESSGGKVNAASP